MRVCLRYACSGVWVCKSRILRSTALLALRNEKNSRSKQTNSRLITIKYPINHRSRWSGISHRNEHVRQYKMNDKTDWKKHQLSRGRFSELLNERTTESTLPPRENSEVVKHCNKLYGVEFSSEKALQDSCRFCLQIKRTNVNKYWRCCHREKSHQRKPRQRHDFQPGTKSAHVKIRTQIRLHE